MDTYGKHGVIGDETCRLDILDLNDSGNVREQAIYTSDGFLLLYDISSKITFDEIPLLFQEICRIKGAVPAMILVGSKLDRAIFREVSFEEAAELREKLGCQFIEASAMENLNVDEAFSLLVNKPRLQTGRSTHDRTDSFEEDVKSGHGLVTSNSSSGSVVSVFGLFIRNLLSCAGWRK